MIRLIFLFVTLAVTTLFIAACGGTSESGLASIGAQAGPAGAETPAPTVGSTTSDTGLATATATSTPTAEATGSQSATAEVATPAPTVAPTAASIPRTTPAGSGGETAAEAQPSSTVTPAAQAETPRTLITQALDSPGLMWCLADKVGMETVLQLSHRAPTAQENYSIRLCFFDKREIAAWDAEWPKRIDAAFAPAVCGDKPTKDFPASYYQGPLIDSHLHIPQLPDDTVGDAPVDGYVETRGAESDLYDTIAKEQRPLLGRTMDINRIACTLRNEGSIKAFAFFPTFPEITVPAIEVAYRTVERYPSLFVPFLQASANGATTLAGESLEVMLVSSTVPVATLFRNLRIVIVDEVHAFAGTDREAHFLSVLERIARYTENDIQRVGLSATIGNPEAILRWLTGSSKRKGRVVAPLKDPAPRRLSMTLCSSTADIAAAASVAAEGKKSLFFCESRSLTEAVAQRMRARDTEVFVHHSSVSKEERADAERNFHDGINFCIACTSTLELGLDVAAEHPERTVGEGTVRGARAAEKQDGDQYFLHGNRASRLAGIGQGC